MVICRSKVQGETWVALSQAEFQAKARLSRERWLAEREAAVVRTMQGSCREPLPGTRTLFYGERWNPQKSWKAYRPHQYKVG